MEVYFPIAIFVAILVALAAWAARKNFYAFAQVVSIVSLVVALVALMWIFEDPMAHPIALSMFVIATLSAVGCIWYLVASNYRKDKEPNPLRDVFDDSSISELRDVQFVVSQPDTHIESGNTTSLIVTAQNCVDASRNLKIELGVRDQILKKTSDLRFQIESELQLGPLEAAELEIPIVFGAQCRGKYLFDVRPKVDGRGGKRIRKWRAKTFEQRTSGCLTVVLAPLGLFIWGGGLTVTFVVKTNPNTDRLRVT